MELHALLASLRRLTLLVQMGYWMAAQQTEASQCNPDQIVSCKNAAIDNNLSLLQEGGECYRNKYIDYTHVCSVVNYMPTVDYCCCAFQRKVLCCRYHYNWNYYRCSEQEDTIHELSGGEGTDLPLTLEVLIPVIVFPCLILLCFIFCCVKCCCHHKPHTPLCCVKRRRNYEDKCVQIEESSVVANDGLPGDHFTRKAGTDYFCSPTRDTYAVPSLPNCKPPEYSALPDYTLTNIHGTRGVQPTAPPMEYILHDNVSRSCDKSVYCKMTPSNTSAAAREAETDTTLLQRCGEDVLSSTSTSTTQHLDMHVETCQSALPQHGSRASLTSSEY